jgi:hypothetical protein
MINGGPCTNHYGGPGGKSEFRTSCLNCLFLFCKVECEFTYVVFFETLSNLVFTLFGLPPFVPNVAGSDRSRAIVNAAVAVWPGVHCVLCWPHVAQYLKDGKMAKHMSPECTKELRERIEDDIYSLHEARTQQMFDFLVGYMAEVWTKEGEGGFALYFKRHYGTGVWSHWWVRAADVPGVPANQNPLECRHSRQKHILGPNLLKACPGVMFRTCAPLLLSAEAVSNAKPSKWPATLEVTPRLSAPMAAKARNLLGTLQTTKVTSQARS